LDMGRQRELSCNTGVVRCHVAAVVAVLLIIEFVPSPFFTKSNLTRKQLNMIHEKTANQIVFITETSRLDFVRSRAPTGDSRSRLQQVRSSSRSPAQCHETRNIPMAGYELSDADFKRVARERADRVWEAIAQRASIAMRSVWADHG